MNCFSLIKRVLDETYEAIEGTNRQKDERIKNELQRLTNIYKNISVHAGPNFRDPTTRFAYVFRYVTAHATLVYSEIRWSVELRALFKRDQVSISCLGGGPGSDMLGILKYLDASGLRPTLQFWHCDRENLWSETWSDIGDKLDYSSLRSTYFVQDVTGNDWPQHSKYLQADLFTMIYFLSEVTAQKDKARPYFENLFKKAKRGAIILFIDNDHSDFLGWFDELTREAGLHTLRSTGGCAIPPPDEQSGVLRAYADKFGGYPKVKANRAVRILRKP